MPDSTVKLHLPLLLPEGQPPPTFDARDVRKIGHWMGRAYVELSNGDTYYLACPAHEARAIYDAAMGAKP